MREALEALAVQVDEALVGRTGRLRERIDPQLLDQRQRRLDISLAQALPDRPIQGIAVEGGILQHEIAGRGLAYEGRRKQQILAALALVLACRTDVGHRLVPGVDHGTQQSGARRRRDFDHHRPIPQIEVEVDVVRRSVRRRHLEAPICWLREVADVVVVRPRVTEVRLPHGVGIHERHAPDGGLDGAPLDGAPGQVASGEILDRRRGYRRAGAFRVRGLGHKPLPR